MERIISNEAKTQVGKEILLKGWLHSLRLLGKVNFLILRDRGGLIQVVVEEKSELNKVKDLQPGSILTIKGRVQESSQTDLGVEVVIPEINVDVAVEEPWPVEVNKPEIRAGLDTILDNRPLTLRNERIAAVFKVQATLLETFREYLIENDFVEFMGPSIISASSEGGSELFNVDYFGYEAKLAQSNQLYKQMMVGVYERVFGTLKCFRAENSNTTRHITEATQLEFEVGFIEKFEEILDWEEKIMRVFLKKLHEKNAKELKMFEGVAELPDDSEIPRMTLKEALELYHKETGTDERNEPDLSPEAERFLCKYAKEKHGTDFIFVTHFPREKCAFYAKPNKENPEVCNYGDLLCNGAEIISGGQRMDKYEDLVESLKAKDLDPKDFVDYLSIFKYGMPSHGGFGLGLERLTKQILNLENIREAVLFPSDPKRIAGVSFSRSFGQGDDMVEVVRKLLDDNKLKYEFFEHEATVTSEDAAKVRGTKAEEGAKALVLRGKKTGRNVMVVLPGNKKINMKKIAELEGEKFSFETPERLKEKHGLEVGGVPPFGNLLGLETYFDKSVQDEEYASFNCGSKFKSIRMKSEDLVEVVSPKVAEISQ